MLISGGDFLRGRCSLYGQCRFAVVAEAKGCVLYLNTKGNYTNLFFRSGDRGDTVVKVLFYKSEGRWFDPSWCRILR